MDDNITEYLLELIRYQEENKRLQPNDYVDSDYVCVHYNGELIKPNFVSQHFRWFLQKKGLRLIRFHDLRHSAASNLLSLGFSLKEIQEWLGHAYIMTTANLYAKVDMTMKRGMAYKLGEWLKISSGLTGLGMKYNLSDALSDVRIFSPK